MEKWITDCFNDKKKLFTQGSAIINMHTNEIFGSAVTCRNAKFNIRVQGK